MSNVIQNLAALRETLVYAQESAKLDFSIQLHELMERASVSQKELSSRVGTSQAYISKALRGDGNLTIETMVALVRGAHGKLHFKVTSEDSVAWWPEVFEGGRKVAREPMTDLWRAHEERPQSNASYDIHGSESDCDVLAA
ncbi:MAG TPA: helix-turn-helix transcriptional regulator [Frateuria sp.]|uniref:helix-turn-helix domain-containing protein n=1 Tax=Frateuria sp. TaxID=2211372 RepID=UPI002D7F4027|nr:helix-turn-helix transcriptional regulator [Frateuria sp.]HET6805983.1 helix-turn-helix transcriptional regulator [Frateuria sp.]